MRQELKIRVIFDEKENELECSKPPAADVSSGVSHGMYIIR